MGQTQKPAKADELFFVVDENDQPLNPLPRKFVHGHGVWHRVAHLCIVNEQRWVLCHQRSLDVELSPGAWAMCLGGHNNPGESYEQAAIRELKEEVGIDIESASRPWKIHKFSGPGSNNEFQAIFIIKWGGRISDLHFSDNEVSQAVWKEVPAIRKGLAVGESWATCGYEQDLLNAIETQSWRAA